MQPFIGSSSLMLVPLNSKLLGQYQDVYAHPDVFVRFNRALDPLLDSHRQNNQDIHTKNQHIHYQVPALDAVIRKTGHFSGHAELWSEDLSRVTCMRLLTSQTLMSSNSLSKRGINTVTNIEGIYLYLSLGLYSDLQPLNYKSLKIFESLLFEKFLVVSN